MSSSIEETSIPRLGETEKRDRKQSPKLWNLPKVDKSFQRKLEELKPFQKAYTELFYKIGKEKYGLNPQSDFVVDVILPTGKFSDLSYDIIAGPIVQLIFTVCSTKEFEKLIFPVLEMVRDSLHTKQ